MVKSFEIQVKLGMKGQYQLIVSSSQHGETGSYRLIGETMNSDQ